MPSEVIIQQLMDRFRRFSKQQRENLLVALLAHKAQQDIGGFSVVMDPKWAAILQPLLQDAALRECLPEALMRLEKEDKKKSGWRRFFGGGS